MYLSGHLLTLHVFVVVLALTIYVVSSHSLRLHRHPSAAIAWVVALGLLPYAALPLYLIFGIRKIKIGPAAAKTPGPTARVSADRPSARMQQLAAIMSLPPACTYARLNLHQHGEEALASLRHMIDQARHSLDICTFIFAHDDLGDDIVQRLSRRARDGIRVRVLVDGVGIYLGGRRHLKALSAAGIETAMFVPPLRSSLRGRTNLRNHRKLLIADGHWLWCGGRNLAAEYFLGEPMRSPPTPPWLDLSLDLQGPLAQQAQALFEQDWHFARHGVAAASSPPEPATPAETAPTGQLIASGPDQSDDTLYTLLISGFFTARRRIVMVSPYFVPDPTLLMSLSLAARRGIAVELVLPMRSNHRLADIARHRALRELTAAGACIRMLPQMNHAKAIVIDDELALIGTANLDGRSLFLNYELMLAIYDAADVGRIAAWIEARREEAMPYEAQAPGFWRDIGEGLLLWLAFQL